MSKKGISKISIIFFAIVFMIFWAVAFAPLLSAWGHAAVVAGEYVGLEAFFYNNINFFIAGIFAIFILAVAAYGE